MAGSDVVEAMQLALKPFHMQHLADDWAAQAGEKNSLQLSVKPYRAATCQHPPAPELCCCWGGPDPPSTRALLLGGGSRPPQHPELCC